MPIPWLLSLRNSWRSDGIIERDLMRIARTVAAQSPTLDFDDVRQSVWEKWLRYPPTSIKGAWLIARSARDSLVIEMNARGIGGPAALHHGFPKESFSRFDRRFLLIRESPAGKSFEDRVPE